MLTLDEATGEFSWQEVLDHREETHPETVTIRVRRFGGRVSETIVTTRAHPIYVRGKGWVPAADIEPGDEVVTAVWTPFYLAARADAVPIVAEAAADLTLALAHAPTGVSLPAPGVIDGAAIVASVELALTRLEAHNLVVATTHTFFVGETAVWVHNGNCDFHGNSLKSTRQHHQYDIVDTQTGNINKTGISGQDLNANGTSPRANRQVNRMNAEEGTPRYKADVVNTGMPGRRQALDAEKDRRKSLRDQGQDLPGNRERGKKDPSSGPSGPSGPSNDAPSRTD